MLFFIVSVVQDCLMCCLFYLGMAIFVERCGLFSQSSPLPFLPSLLTSSSTVSRYCLSQFDYSLIGKNIIFVTLTKKSISIPPAVRPLGDAQKEVKHAMHARRLQIITELEVFCEEEWVQIPKRRTERLLADYKKRFYYYFYSFFYFKHFSFY